MTHFAGNGGVVLNRLDKVTLMGARGGQSGGETNGLKDFCAVAREEACVWWGELAPSEVINQRKEEPE